MLPSLLATRQTILFHLYSTRVRQHLRPSSTTTTPFVHRPSSCLCYLSMPRQASILFSLLARTGQPNEGRPRLPESLRGDLHQLLLCIFRCARTRYTNTPTRQIQTIVYMSKHSTLWNGIGREAVHGACSHQTDAFGSSHADFVIFHRSRLATARRLLPSSSPSRPCRASTASSSGKNHPPPCYGSASHPLY